AAVREQVAAPLGASIEEAALRIKKQMDATVGASISLMLAQKGFDGRDFVMFAYGGAGPVHCCGYAEQAGISRIVTSPFASVFSAYGASMMDVVHTYIKTRPVRLFDASTDTYLSDLEDFNSVVRGLRERGLVDMRGEGFKPDEVQFALDLVIAGEGGSKAWVTSPRLLLYSMEDVEAICRECRAKSEDQRDRDVTVQSFMLKAIACTPHWEAPLQRFRGEDPQEALTGEREVYWESAGGLARTPIYRRELLQPGNVVAGPAVVDAVDTACVVPPGWKLSVDSYLNGILQKASRAEAS
ncbi:MAG TPA: hydantoinase/oxoprolinase family protein, partial [Dehalococcoidia bacterium]|nr:hydantoinase/oxoprolinase family protein [Dehalococcoidia bacterium]